MTKFNKSNYMAIPPLDMYDMVLNKELDKFPDRYLDKQACKEIIRYIVIDILHMSREEICQNVALPFLRKYHISTFRKFWDCKIYSMIDFCFPEMKIKPWELTRVSNDFWKNQKNQKDYLLWLIQKYNFDIKNPEDMKKITAQFVIKNHGKRALTATGGIFPLLTLVTGDMYQEWEISKTFKWNDESAKKALKWLFEERLKWNYEQIAKNLSAQTFKDNSLGGLFENYFYNNKLAALNLVYPNIFTRDGLKIILK